MIASSNYSQSGQNNIANNYTLFHWYIDTEIKENAMKEIRKALRMFKRKGTIDC